MSTTSQFYSVFLLIDLLLAIPLYKSWKTHLAAWRQLAQGWHYVLMVVAVLLMVSATVVWGFMTWYSLNAWQTALHPGHPKPYILIIWGICVLVYGFALAIAQPLHLVTLGREREML